MGCTAVHASEDSAVNRVHAASPDRSGGISSTRDQMDQDISANGQKISFRTNRSGTFEIWICDSNGSNLSQLTSLGAPNTGTPRWSPDGQQIAFDSRQEGHSDIYAINAEGGSPHRLTTEPFENNVPSWSRDGRWIYFGSNRSGTEQIWKMPPQGGQAAQVTKQGDLRPSSQPTASFCTISRLRPVRFGECPLRAVSKLASSTGRSRGAIGRSWSRASASSIGFDVS